MDGLRQLDGVQMRHGQVARFLDGVGGIPSSVRWKVGAK